jgi:pyruvate/2-oxoglutarate dehydrogenase complex dihydrolipoamide dehydrogenase (E3) component
MIAESPRRGAFDVVVIGAGSAGLVSASGAAGLGARTAIIEKARFGGECLWTGCVPSKALIRTAQLRRDARCAGDVGLEPSEIGFHFSEVMASMRAVIARIEPHDAPQTMQERGITTIHGTARILAPHRIVVAGEELETKRIVIATGSRPVLPPIEGIEDVGYLTHETILELEERPQRLIVLGAGPVGLEFAQIFARLGTGVTVVEMASSILPREDAEASAALREILAEEGIEFRLGWQAVAAERAGDGARLRLEGREGSRSEVTGDVILVATGMRPFTESLGLENAGVELTSDGAIRVDDTMRTSAANVWAAGDVTGKLFFTHVADYQARLVVRNMFFPFRGKADYGRIGWATFTDPTLARIGLTESQARERHGDRVRVYRQPFDDLDRAITDRAGRGFVKLVTDARGRLLGAHILGSHADAVIHEVAIAMRSGMKAGPLSQLVHIYPTWPEGVRRAADAYYRERFAESRLRPLIRWWVRR